MLRVLKKDVVPTKEFGMWLKPKSSRTIAFFVLVTFLCLVQPEWVSHASGEEYSAASQSEETNLRYVYEITSEMSMGEAGETVSGTTTSTYYVIGDWQRIGGEGQSAYTIVQCDLRRQILIDSSQNTCCVLPLFSGGAIGRAPCR